jgi:signal transduction histidine kinase
VAVLAHPLHGLDGSPLGALWTSQPSPRRWQPAHRRHIARLAGLAAASLDRQQASAARARLRRAHEVLAHEVGHQLRSPLTILLGQLELLADGSLGALSPAQQAAVDAAERAARRLCEQTVGLLVHSGLEPGP